MILDSDLTHLHKWLDDSEEKEAQVFGDMKSNEEQLCRRALTDLVFWKGQYDAIFERCAALVGHESEDPIEEILTTLETLFSK
jgi:phage-related minor tail protein